MTLPLIYFIRHGQTDWNAESRIQGRIDVPINGKGREQARRNGGILAEVIPDAAEFDFFASPMLRTRQTMEIIRETMGLATDGFGTDERLMEISFGTWGGKIWTDIAVSEPEAFAERQADIWNWIAPEGESYAQLYARIRAFFEELTRPSVVVSHGGVMRCLRGLVLDLPFEGMVRLDVPQDKVLKIEAGTLTWL